MFNLDITNATTGSSLGTTSPMYVSAIATSGDEHLHVVVACILRAVWPRINVFVPSHHACLALLECGTVVPDLSLVTPCCGSYARYCLICALHEARVLYVGEQFVDILIC